ncbi:MAG: right-handed parallel beta-helix repeat-containing protein [Acidobacteriia bacterium]|nr:right-handed parallel beta-helix repeat-containing protein [Terriglobia bacterium]
MNQKQLAMLSALALSLTLGLMMFGGHTTYAAGPWYVDSVQGNDANGCMAPGISACKTIQAAIDKTTSSGDTIYVAAGTYYEHLVVNTPNIKLLGESRDTTIIDATQDPAWSVAKAGILIRGTGESRPGASGVEVKHFTIQNAQFQTGGVPFGGDFYGVGAGGLTGIQIYGSSGNTIEDNIVERSGYQVWVLAEWSAAGYGDANDNVITGNIIRDSAVEGHGVYLYTDDSVSVKNTVITNNEISNITTPNYSAIRFRGEGGGTISGTIVENNSIHKATYGIRLSDLLDITGTVIHQNNISGNGTGLRNQLDATVDATCNWWGAASGPGPVGPGVGDPVSENVIYSPWLIGPPPGSVCTVPTKKECKKATEDNGKAFDQQQKADKKAFDDQQKADKKAFDATHPSPQDRQAFDEQQKAADKAFDDQQKADKKAFDKQNEADKKQCDQLPK